MERATILAALALSGCTLVVGGVTPPACSTNSQCAILNEVNGIAAEACERYQCSPNAICELGVRDDDRDGLIAPECATAAPQLPVDCNDAVPGGTEVCNGLDDDCDGVIDERFVDDGVAANPLPAELPMPLVEGTFSEAGRVGYGTGGSALAMAYAEGGTASFGLASGSTNTGPVDMSFARAAVLADLLDTALAPGCDVWDGTSAMSGDTCRFHELELGLTQDAVFTSAISQGGCSHGQVRVGYFPRSSASTPTVIERGPLRRTTVFGGVDVGALPEGNRCTGASRSSGVWGAARPALAAMDLSGTRDQALTAWIADGFGREACGGEEADVEVLALHVQEATFGVTYGWISGSNEGRPQVVGRTSGGGRPGIGAWDNTGYVVAFGAPGGGVHLAFVEMMEAPPAFTTDGDPDDRTGLETAPLTVTDLGVIDAGAADDVVVATGSIRTGGIDLGLAWREGCGSGSETVRFRQLFLARDGSGNVSIDEARSFEAIDLTPAATSEAGPPAIVYAFDGMLAPGVDRAGDRPTGTPETDGGWIVAWSDASEPDPGRNDDTRILARRVSEADGVLLNDEEVLVLNAPGDVRRSRPVLYRGEGDRVLHAFLTTGSESAFRGGALTCVPGE